MGKTRLILQAAHCLTEQTATHRYPDGVYWVDLTAAHSYNELVSAVMISLHCHLSEANPAQQLREYLTAKQLLLVLDNFEQLQVHAALLENWLAAAPHLEILVSSRTPLKLLSEWRFPLGGLSIENAEAHLLFDACAQRFDPHHDPQHPAITRICTLLGGMPLAIEMAAAWLRLLSPDEIAGQINQNLTLLQVQESSIEPRQANIHEVLAQSWCLLAAAERQTLCALSVFMGGFTLDAAREAAEASLVILAGLADKALLQRNPDGRYRLHELIRQYAGERLDEYPGQSVVIHQQHSRYYLGKLKAGNRAEQRRLIQELDSQEFGNIQIAWSTAISQADWPLLKNSVETLFAYCSIGGRYAQGVDLFGSARTAVPESEIALRKICQHRWMALRALLGEQNTAYRYFHNVVENSELPLVERIFVRLQLGQLAVWQDQADYALPQLRIAFNESRTVTNTELQAWTAERLAQMLLHLGQVDEALKLAAESLALWRELEHSDEIAIAYALDTLGFAAFCRGDFDHAEHCYEESFKIFEAHNDINGSALALGGLGIISSCRQTEKAAITQLQRAVELARQAGHRLHLFTRLSLLASGCSLLYRCDLASSAAQEGLRIARDLGINRYSILSRYHLSEVALGLRDLSASRHHLRQGLVLVRAGYDYETTRLLTSCAHWLVRYADQCTQQQQQLAYFMAEQLLAGVSSHPACWEITRIEIQRIVQRLPKSLKKRRKIFNGNIAAADLYELTQQCLATYWAADRGLSEGPDPADFESDSLESVKDTGSAEQI